MNFQLKLQNERLENLNGQLAYSNEALSQTDIKSWEKKEFEICKAKIINEIAECEALIKVIKSL